MHRTNNDRLDRLIIFSRYPIPGKTKTRLIPELGKAGAAELQRRLTEATFKTAQEIASCHRTSVAVCFEGGNGRKMRQWLGDPAIYSHQAGGNLGNRMQVAFAEAFQQGCLRVVLIGADIPGVTTDLLEKAFDALQIMEKHNITVLVVVEKKRVVGLLHIHDLVKAGIKS